MEALAFYSLILQTQKQKPVVTPDSYGILTRNARITIPLFLFRFFAHVTIQTIGMTIKTTPTTEQTVATMIVVTVDSDIRLLPDGSLNSGLLPG